jgi:hypothetical protein
MGAMDTIPVDLARSDIRDKDMPVVVCPVLARIEPDCPERSGIFRMFKQQQFHCIRVLRKDAEIDASMHDSGSERKTASSHSIH